MEGEAASIDENNAQWNLPESEDSFDLDHTISTKGTQQSNDRGTQHRESNDRDIAYASNHAASLKSEQSNDRDIAYASNHAASLKSKRSMYSVHHFETFKIPFTCMCQG